jgi:hypothetical protein
MYCRSDVGIGAGGLAVCRSSRRSQREGISYAAAATTLLPFSLHAAPAVGKTRVFRWWCRMVSLRQSFRQLENRMCEVSPCLTPYNYISHTIYERNDNAASDTCPCQLYCCMLQEADMKWCESVIRSALRRLVNHCRILFDQTDRQQEQAPMIAQFRYRRMVRRALVVWREGSCSRR